MKKKTSPCSKFRALMIGTTTALTGLPTPVMAQENTEVVQEAIVEENKTEQVPVEQETENAENAENFKRRFDRRKYKNREAPTASEKRSGY